MSDLKGNTQSEFFNNLSKLIGKEYGGKDKIIINLYTESDTRTITEFFDEHPKIVTVHTITFTTVSK